MNTLVPQFTTTDPIMDLSPMRCPKYPCGLLNDRVTGQLDDPERTLDHDCSFTGYGTLLTTVIGRGALQAHVANTGILSTTCAHVDGRKGTISGSPLLDPGLLLHRSINLGSR